MQKVILEMIIKTKLEIIKVKWTEEMNKNLLWFELIKLDTMIWIEALADGVQGIKEKAFERMRRLRRGCSSDE